MKLLPFVIERDSPLDLTRQVVRGFTQAVRSGHYAPGEPIPSIRRIAKALGVSIIVVRNAVRRLAEEGLVIARPRRGIVVRQSEAPRPWRAHVLQLTWTPNTSFYFASRQRVFEERLREAGVGLSVVRFDQGERERGLPTVRSLAEAGLADLAVFEGSASGVAPLLCRRRIPFVQVFTPKPSPKAVGSVVEDEGRAVEELVQHCKACGARRVLGVFKYKGRAGSRFAAALRSAGLAGEILTTGEASRLNPEGVEEAGLAAMAKYLGRGRARPDLIYFADDYIGRGGLMALAWAGVRVPEDVQVITHANRGNRVAFPKALTRMEVDPDEAGRAMARVALGALGLSRGARHVVLTVPRLVVGKTTVPRRKG